MDSKLAHQKRLMFDAQIKKFQTTHTKHQKQISKPTLMVKSHSFPIRHNMGQAKIVIGRNNRPFFSGQKH
jgi:hypothetical protein